MKSSSKGVLIVAIIIIILLCIYLVTGFFIVQPIGAIPKGASVWYFRFGLKLPFISSADGLLVKEGMGVSLFGRAMMMGKLFELIQNRIIFKLPYSNALYSISTNGARYE
jgi:hypothetical protein